MIKEMKKNEKGFSLVELVVVIAILAILALLIVPRVMGSMKEAERSKEIANARVILSEIAAHNALVIADEDSTEETIPKDLNEARPLVAADLAPIDRVDDFPDDTIVEIMYDGAGNVELDIKDQDASPTPVPAG